MRRFGKLDANQRVIVDALRRVGCSVLSLASHGQGCPDLLVGTQNRNLLLEIKDGNQPPSKQKLTTDEMEWIAGWRGQVFVVTSVEEALDAVNNENINVSNVMKAMGRKGGEIGGKRRLDTMTPEQRRDVAVKAARTRWGQNE